jgi:lipoprotein LprG
MPTHRPEPSAERPPSTRPSRTWWQRKAVLISAASIVIVVATVLVVTLATTGNHTASQTSQTSQSALPDAATLLNQSAQTTRALKSARLVQTVAGKIQGFPIKTLTGDLTTSPTTAASGNELLTVAGSDIDMNFVILDGVLYATLTPNKWSDFGKASDIYDPTVFLNPNIGLANVLSNFSNPEVVGSETIDGAQTVRITGQVSADAANKIIPQIAASGPVPGTAWIREDSNHELVQVTLEPSPGNSIQMTLSNWNNPVSVTKPPGV